jgi:hypothetical protein
MNPGLIVVGWIRVRTSIGNADPDLDAGGQNEPQKKRKKAKKYVVKKCWMFSFEG